jgi:serine/threonine protein kinase
MVEGSTESRGERKAMAHVGYVDERQERARRRAWHRRLLSWSSKWLRGEDAQTAPDIDKPPSSVASRYRLGERLGSGGMAEVFRATMIGAERFERTVAIKRILPELARQEWFVKLFVQEAHAIAQMSHPNIVSVLDFERDPAGQLLLVLEFVDGVDLNRLLQSGPLPYPVVIFLVTEILNGLGYAHGLSTGGIVHRDLSPHNILLSWGGAVKVADFGLAQPRDANQATASFPQGKFAFMSPEQIEGKALDGRSDLFSVGVMLWEMLAGERLFGHGDTTPMRQRMLDQPIVRPGAIRPVAPDLEAVAMRLLERDPARRYPTAEGASAALARCRDASLQGRAELVRLLAERSPRRPIPTSFLGLRRPRRRTASPHTHTRTTPRRWPVVLAVTASLCAAAAVGAFVGLELRARRSIDGTKPPQHMIQDPRSLGSTADKPCNTGSAAISGGRCPATSPALRPARSSSPDPPTSRGPPSSSP